MEIVVLRAMVVTREWYSGSGGCKMMSRSGFGVWMVVVMGKEWSRVE